MDSKLDFLSVWFRFYKLECQCVILLFAEACSELDSDPVSESEVVAWYQTIIWSANISVVTKQYALMSLTKLSTRFTTVTSSIQQVQCHVSSLSFLVKYDHLRQSMHLVATLMLISSREESNLGSSSVAKWA